jgi:hypothetical protein
MRRRRNLKEKNLKKNQNCCNNSILTLYGKQGCGVGVGDLKIEKSDSEVLCTDSTALMERSV